MNNLVAKMSFIAVCILITGNILNAQDSGAPQAVVAPPAVVKTIVQPIKTFIATAPANYIRLVNLPTDCYVAEKTNLGNNSVQVPIDGKNLYVLQPKKIYCIMKKISNHDTIISKLHSAKDFVGYNTWDAQSDTISNAPTTNYLLINRSGSGIAANNVTFYDSNGNSIGVPTTLPSFNDSSLSYGALQIPVGAVKFSIHDGENSNSTNMPVYGGLFNLIPNTSNTIYNNPTPTWYVNSAN